MLKDVGMAVPKARETRVVYIPQDKAYNNNWRAERTYLVVQLAQFFYIY